MKKKIINHNNARSLRFVVNLNDKDDQKGPKLIDFILQNMPNKSRTTVKQLLRDRFVSVNGVAETLATRVMTDGMEVIVHAHPLPDKLNNPMLDILYQDDEIVICFKRAGIPTVGTSFEKKNTALRILSEHLKQYNPKTKVYMINRLDNDTAGFVIFAKNKDAQAYFTDHWDQIVLSQVYRCVVEGIPPLQEGLLLKPLKPEEGKKQTAKLIAELDPTAMVRPQNGMASYKLLKKGPHNSLLEIKLLAGRNNQIRKQMKQVGMPLCGDKRGGSVIDDLEAVALQMIKMVFVHPLTHEEMVFMEKMPSVFSRLVLYVPEKY
ncbi:MAG: pseudouridine synthase [Porphyromonadaceae bacterium]|nr:pseudouridine synthase [Porphyromonadaceae bacterium]